jgi:peptidyl-prolyl cis-trans isomerase B (cyclophilin B)
MNPVVTIEMENGSIIHAELYPEVAPTRSGTSFRSSIKAIMTDNLPPRNPRLHDTGRLPQGTGMGGPGYSIKGEFTGNGFKNDLKHDVGVLSMARTMAPDSAGSQFFIMHENSPPSGRAVRGLRQGDGRHGSRQRHRRDECDFRDKPVKPQKMKKVTVDTFGVDYPEPEKA